MCNLLRMTGLGKGLSPCNYEGFARATGADRFAHGWIVQRRLSPRRFPGARRHGRRRRRAPLQLKTGARCLGCTAEFGPHTTAREHDRSTGTSPSAIGNVTAVLARRGPTPRDQNVRGGGHLSRNGPMQVHWPMRPMPPLGSRGYRYAGIHHSMQPRTLLPAHRQHNDSLNAWQLLSLRGNYGPHDQFSKILCELKRSKTSH